MAPKFGTSGLRGLVSELTDDLCARYARAFLQVCAPADTVMIARDLRPSSERIAAAVASGAAGLGVRVIDCGEVPTPALALAALGRGVPSVMVTGSHIPADRNGLKFYSPRGEITKAEEGAIGDRAARDAASVAPGPAVTERDETAGPRYVDRYLAYFDPGALAGLRVGVYQHSTVAREMLGDVLRGLGAEAIPLGRSDHFIPVDTEAVDPATRQMLRGWAAAHRLDAIVSADGDADRPLLADAAGEVVPGDVLGTLTAMALGADTVVTPVSSNTMVEASGAFAGVIRTRIGSPFVIAGMEAAATAPCRPVGFEANGGFLLGFDVPGLPRLMTRDSFLPIFAPLAAAHRRGVGLTGLIDRLPARRTAADRLENVATVKSLALVARLSGDADARGVFFAGFGPEAGVDRTDGLRVTFADGLILHLRPSGNAPELRCYAEAPSLDAATSALREVLTRARAAVA